MIFHILNGDALLSQFPDEIPGERISFRECLIDGPVKANSMEEFWRMRKDFIEKSFPQNPELDYSDYSQKEIEKISRIPEGSHVYCWFEEDLFCQVNLWFSISMLQGKELKVLLVLPPPSSPFSFSYLDQKELLELYAHNPIKLETEERKVLKMVWAFFQNKNPEKAQKLAEKHFSYLPFLRRALKFWEEMIPKNGYLGKPKETLMAIHKTNPEAEFGFIFREFQKRIPEYGFGDLQVLNMCRELGIMKKNI
ncbi:DUF1835 domain-containing protein [Algoriphagus mannitolivorans]|uniref:DUF1835 domain-containing protein n=1 Tax=Algoriphagus mannitolivorans TaxID=226504 RepID=UPI00040C9186|nr:DUF1835 domain-containing protein [Algoriphagus mannitolivorans]